MKVISLLLIAVAPCLYGQDTTSVVQERIPIEEARPTLSETPTAAELKALLTSGQWHISDVLDRVVERGDKAVLGLRDLILDIGSSSTTVSDSGSAAVDRLPLIKALERIGSNDAFAALMQCESIESDPQMRCAIISTLSRAHSNMSANQPQPSKEVVRIFIMNLGDHTFSGEIQRTTRQLAQEGLRRWLGLDFGDWTFRNERIQKGEVGKELSDSEYAKIWWEENESKLVWNGESSHFQVQ